jgi:hypothetical protein
VAGAIGILALVIAGSTGLVGSVVLGVSSASVPPAEAAGSRDPVYLFLNVCSATFYTGLVVSAPWLWQANARRKWLGAGFLGVIGTVILSGSAGGFVLFAPPLLILPLLMLLPKR